MKRASRTRFPVETQRDKGRTKPDLRLLFEAGARACKEIAIAVDEGSLGNAGRDQVEGER